MNDWGRFDDQFRETEYERQERWRVTRQQRRQRGECWQCGKKIAACTCPNVSHEQDDGMVLRGYFETDFTLKDNLSLKNR